MKPILAALSFLTILPLPAQEYSEEDLSRSVRFFPLVGLLLGLFTAGLASVFYGVLPPLPAAVLLVLALTGFSGALHLDGLADTADGLLSSRPRERVLEIMRDSHVGTMGVLAIVGVLFLKVAAFASLPLARVNLVVLIAAITPLAGRTCMVIGLCLQVYAREEGLGRVYFQNRMRLEAVASGAGLVLLSLLLAGWPGLIAGVMVCGFACAWALYTTLRLGGGTGDTLGAGGELAELIPVLVITVILNLQGTVS